MAGPHWEFEGPALLAPPPASLQAVRATCHPPDLPRWLGRASGLHPPTPPGDTDTAPACLGPSDRWSVSTCVPRHLLPRGPLPAGSDGSHRNAIISRLDRRYPARPAPSTTVWSADGAVAGQLESPCPRTSFDAGSWRPGSDFVAAARPVISGTVVSNRALVVELRRRTGR